MPNRRTFLLNSAATLATAAACSTAADLSAKESAKNLPLVDTHQHLWDLKLFQPPWLAGAPDVLSKSYVTKDYLQATKGLHLAKAVYMEVDVAVKDQVREARHVIALSKSDDHPTAGAVISGRPNSPDFAAYIKQFAKSPQFKGVRQVLHVPDAKRGLCLEKQFVQSVRLLGELARSFDLCMRPTELKDGAKLADLCKDTRLIVDHCGNADPKSFMKKPPAGAELWHQVDEWKRGIHALAERPNVICKISGIVARAPQPKWSSEHLAPIINFCLDEFGPDRVVFGGDWPVCLLGGEYAQWVRALKEVIAERKLVDQKKLLHDNAVRLYRL
ncbi:MAG: amidohydrolase family protein [Pirellulaceae bacterium]|jgi:predicted TIM-barrel fold metal-dependent hydrolase|nr:amidohydrolase family protein [Pirellulaceae bacterium]MDP7018634.1 amidohydrolase family protein [Pirellulaceae bacterium]